MKREIGWCEKKKRREGRGRPGKDIKGTGAREYDLIKLVWLDRS
jgi:hypothetical protein